MKMASNSVNDLNNDENIIVQQQQQQQPSSSSSSSSTIINNDKNGKNLKVKSLLSSETISEWTLVYSDSNSSIFDSTFSSITSGDDNDNDDDNKTNRKNNHDKNSKIVHEKIIENLTTDDNNKDDKENNDDKRKNSETSSSSIIILNSNDGYPTTNDENDAAEKSDSNIPMKQARKLSLDCLSTTTFASNSTGNNLTTTTTTTTDDSEINTDDDELLCNNNNVNDDRKSIDENSDVNKINDIQNVKNKKTGLKYIHQHQRIRNRFNRSTPNSIRRRKTFQDLSNVSNRKSANFFNNSTSQPTIFLNDQFDSDNINDNKNIYNNDIILVDKFDDHNHKSNSNDGINNSIDNSSLMTLSLPLSTILAEADNNDANFSNRFNSFKYYRQNNEDNQDNHADDSNTESEENMSEKYNDFPSIMNRKTKHIRAYFHQPNTVLNNKLNFALILSLTAVFGLGIGHFLGWSTILNQKQLKLLSMPQIMKLKQLQDDLMICTKYQQVHLNLKQDSNIDYDNICVIDNDYWSERFKTLFNENENLMELFEKTQKHFAEQKDIDSLTQTLRIFNDDKDDINSSNDNTNIIEQFINLKLDLLIKQMEHLKLIKVLENFKQIGEQNEQRVRNLEHENNQLKNQLIEEEQDDIEMIENYNKLQNENNELRSQFTKYIYNKNTNDHNINNKNDESEKDDSLIKELQSKIDNLNSDNERLKIFLKNLEKQISTNGINNRNNDDNEFIGIMDAIDDQDRQELNYEQLSNNPNESMTIDTSNNNENIESYRQYNSIRQFINQLMLENGELKSKIARYRWTNNNNVNKNINEHQGPIETIENLSPKKSNFDTQHEQEPIEKQLEKKSLLATSKQQLQQQQLDQLKIRLTILNRQLFLSRELNKKLRNENEKIIEKNQILLSKMKKQANKPQQQSSSTFTMNDESNNEKYKRNDYDFYDTIDDDNDNNENDFNNNHHQQQNQIWTLAMEQMKNNYNKLMKNFKKHGKSTKTNLDDVSLKLMNFGKEFMQTTKNSMEKMMKKFSNNHNDNDSNVLKYFSDRFNDFSTIIENGFHKTFDEFKSIINTATTFDDDLIDLNDDDDDDDYLYQYDKNNNNNQMRKKEKKIARKLRKKFRKQQKQNSEMDKNPENWLEERAESRAEARLANEKHMETNIEDWQTKRAKLRAKSRKL